MSKDDIKALRIGLFFVILSVIVLFMCIFGLLSSNTPPLWALIGLPIGLMGFGASSGYIFARCDISRKP